jgi:hypothetical protein
MPTPVQVHDRVLEGLAGDALNAGGLKQIATGILHSSITTDPVYQGRVVHHYISTIGTNYEDPQTTRPLKAFRPGSTAKQVPYMLLRGTNDLDTQGVVDAGFNGYVTTVGTTKLLTGICMIDAFEVATREFDTAQTYLSNEGLRAVRSDSASNAGTLTNQGITWGTTQVCGQVTSGKTVNKYGKDVLHMLAMYAWGSEAAS